MTTTQAQAPSLHDQVLELQDRLIRRGILIRREHEVLDGRLCADGVTTLIECTCGRGLFRPDAESERAYAQHVVSALRSSQALAA